MDYTAQYNFTVGIRGSTIEEAWEDRLTKLGVDKKKPALPSSSRSSVKHQSSQT